MGLQKDILETEVRFTSNEAMAQLKKMESETANLRRENDRLAVTKTKLEAIGKKESEEYQQITARMKQNSSAIKENKSTIESLRKVVGLSALSMTDLRKRANGLTQQLNSMSKAANPSEYNRLEKELAQVRNRMDQLQTGTTRTNAILRGFKALLPALGVAAVVGAIKSLISNIIQVRSEFEKYQAVLKNTLGSSQAARMEMAMLKEFAATTPFQVNELTGAFVKLVNQGFKPNREEMRKLGDLASSTGKDMDMLAEAIIDAQVGEFERLKEFGIRAEKHGDQVKFTFKGISTEVDFTAQSIQKYILGLGDMEGVSGSMNEIMGTLGGRISNLQDAWTSYLDTLGGKTSGIFTTVIGWLTRFVQWVQEATYSVKQIKEMVLDDTTRQNLQSSIEEINVMAGSLMRNGIQQKEAYDRALRLYYQSRDQQIAALKQQIETATGVEKEGLEQRLSVLQAERTAVQDHYTELKKLESGKGGGKSNSKDLLNALKEAHEERILIIKTQYAQELITKERHDADMLSEELAYIQAEIALKKKLGESVVDLEVDYQEKIIKAREEAQDYYRDLVKENEKLAEDFAKQGEDELMKSLEASLKVADAEIESEKAKTESIQKIREDGLKKEQELLQQRAQVYQRTIETLSSAIYDFASGSEDGMRQFAKTILGMALDLLSQQVQLAVAGVTVQSLASAESVATYGAAGLAKAALLVGLIEAAFAGVKGLANKGIDSYYDKKQSSTTKNYYYGGYTPNGYWDQPQGVVHSDEFVANRHAVRNPHVRRFLDVFDLAQRSGQIRSLNTEAILRAVESRRSGYTAGGYAPVSSSNAQMVVASVDPEMKDIVQQNTQVISELKQELKRGISANVSYQDIKKKMKEMDDIIEKTRLTGVQ